MHRGYIKIYRKIADSGLLQTPNTLAVFMHILLNASHKDIKVGTPNGIIELKRGQYISGRIKLARELEQSEQKIRTSLERLESLEILTISSTNKYSIYTIVKYEDYQSYPQEVTSDITNRQPTDNQQITTKQAFNNLIIKNNPFLAKLKKQNPSWRNDDNQIADVATKLGIHTQGKSKFELLAKIDGKLNAI